jgi:hypothetical protein
MANVENVVKDVRAALEQEARIGFPRHSIGTKGF